MCGQFLLLCCFYEGGALCDSLLKVVVVEGEEVQSSGIWTKRLDLLLLLGLQLGKTDELGHLLSLSLGSDVGSDLYVSTTTTKRRQRSVLVFFFFGFCGREEKKKDRPCAWQDGEHAYRG